MTIWTAVLAAVLSAGDVNWPAFRGTDGRGVAQGFATPTKWDVPAGEGVVWKTPIPGLGHGGVVIWGDKLFVTTAASRTEQSLKVGLYGNIASVQDDTPHQWILFCLDKRTGKELWRRTMHEGVPIVKRHTKASHANTTPATDGKRIVIMLGSEGLFCYDLDGELQWNKSLGVLDTGYFRMPSAQWGFASSPVIHGDKVILQVDIQKGSFIAAYALDDGGEIWRTPRDEVPTWGTPAVHGSQVIVNGYKHMGSYDLTIGKPRWHLSGGGDIPVPTPIVAHGLAFITNNHGGRQPMYAIRLDAVGDISITRKQKSSEHIAWCDWRSGAYMQTPIVVGDELYTCSDGGRLICYDARTGEKHYVKSVNEKGGGFTASAVAADGKLYYTSETGEVFVIRAGKQFERLSVNPLGETCMTGPAISEGTLYFHTRHHVMAIGEAKL